MVYQYSSIDFNQQCAAEKRILLPVGRNDLYYMFRGSYNGLSLRHASWSDVFATCMELGVGEILLRTISR